ncbi:MAG: neutral zinc metallopeptidase, partial [Thermocrispum sp.]
MPDSKRAVARESGHRLAVVALCGAIIAALASGVAVLIAVVGSQDDPAPRQAQHAPRDTDGGNAPGGASSTSPRTTTSIPQKVLKLADHPLLAKSGSGLPNQACELPEWENTESVAKRFFRAATRCLDRAWEPVLREHGLPFTPPRLYFPSGEKFSSDCGTIKVGIETAAYYCEGELFLPFGGLQLDQYEHNPGVYLALIAHEYG